MKPVISVVLPVYNGEKHLRRAIESILVQQFTDFELIVVNDCSTDSTVRIVEELVRQDKRIRLLHNKKNLKLPLSLNNGHKAAVGEFITWTSDDNFPHPDWLSSLYGETKDANVDIIFSDYTRINEDGHFLQYCRTGPPEYLAFSSSIGASFLYRRRVFEVLGGYDDKLFLIEDYDFWARAFRKEFIWKHLPVSLYDYCDHKNSLSSLYLEKVAKVASQYKLDHLDEYRMNRNTRFLACMNILQTARGITVGQFLRLFFMGFFSDPVRFFYQYNKFLVKSFLRWLGILA